MTTRRALIALVALLLTAFALVSLVGHGPWAGQPIAAFGGGHGLNTGDVPVLVGWVVGMAACALLWRDRPPR